MATALAEMGYLLTALRPSYGEAKALLEQSAAGFRALDGLLGLSEALMYLCRTNRNIGLFPEALAIACEVYAIAEMNGNVRLLVQAGSNLGLMLAIGNQCHEAYTTLAAALSLTQELGRQSELPNLRSRSLPYRALAMRRLGKGDCGRGDALVTLRLGLTGRCDILVALWVVALLLADAGETTRAAAAFALSEQKRHLDNVWLQDIALRELRACIAGLSPQLAVQAQVRWAQHNIWVALEEICAELEAEGWGMARAR